MIIVIGIVGGYYQLMLFSTLEDKSVGNIFFGKWVFSPESIGKEALRYRRAIFVCWAIVIVLTVILIFR
ncbi:MAG: hypothetical protein KME63_16455 [Candidatus Thiodiazotropha sp. (ex Clathrolucina costata)]|nr:hypothetical protein [Candidatus Thiodiazotropha taylori]